MSTEQEKTLEVLQLAIQMEIDGKEYYQKASELSSSQLGKELFQSLAAEEDIHRQKFEQIYDAISSQQAWPKSDFSPVYGEILKTMFAAAIQEMGPNVKPEATELQAVQTAIDMEQKSYDLYQGQIKNATYDAERAFYEALAAQERGHQLILVDYQEYLADPTGWFTRTEHHSLDGG
ncbi:ferritin family protein [Chloroflexota bacterium]